MSAGLVAPSGTEAGGSRSADLSVLNDLVHRRRGSAPRGTHRMAALCRALGDPQLAQPAVRVAGTDGKTSIVRIVASLLQALGVPSGETTSPHLQHVSERIRICGAPLSADQLRDRWPDLQAAIAVAEAATGEQVTFFEAITALALRLFADEQVQAAVVECGIGGVGDASSVVPGDIAVLSRVGRDHPELGDSLTEVAREKAGIVRSGGVLIASAQDPEVGREIERLTAGRGATLLRAGRDFGVVTRRQTAGGQLIALRGLDGSGVRGHLPLRGAHQAANAAVALAAVQSLLGTCDLDPDKLRAGLAAAGVPGRTEYVRRLQAADVVLDGAHDPEAIEALVASLQEAARPRAVTIVFGVGAGRAPEPLLGPLLGLDAGIIVTQATAPGAMPVGELAQRARASGVTVTPAPDPASAMDRASTSMPSDGLTVVTGSLHLVGDVRRLLAVH